MLFSAFFKFVDSLEFFLSVCLCLSHYLDYFSHKIIHLYVRVHKYIWVHSHGDQRSTLGIVPCDIVLLEFFLRQDFLLSCHWPANLRDLSISARLQVHNSIYLFICYLLGVANVNVKVKVYVWLFYGGPGIKLISSYLHSKLFIDWHIFPAQPSVFPSCDASPQTLTTVEYSHLYTVFPPSVLASNLYRTEVPCTVEKPRSL